MNSTIVKSQNDKNLYKAIELENGLKVLLISDQTNVLDENVQCNDILEADSESECIDDMVAESEEDAPVSEDGLSDELNPKKKPKMAAAALCVNVGSFANPEEFPGIAHFVEHMIFMGSQKYPDENAYGSFVDSHGGSVNADTDTEYTNYHLDINPSHFKEALDIFANCFIAPLFIPDAVDREIEAVDCEFSEAAANDVVRLSLILQTMAKRGHPMSMFAWGNCKTLKEIPLEKNLDIIAAVHKFHGRYYSAQHMTLAVQSTETLETLEDWIREIFSLIPNTNLPSPQFENLLEPFDLEKFHKLYKIIPVKDGHKMYLTWCLPPSLHYYRSKPIHYMEYLIGHEGRGSIMSYLRQKSWALSLAAGSSGSGMELNSMFTMFSIEIKLTESGMDHIVEIMTVIFQYLKMIIQEGPKQYVFDEIKTVKSQKFNFQEQMEAVDYVYILANNMQTYPCEDYITGRKLCFEYDEKAIKHFMSFLTVDSVNIAFMSHRFSKDVCKEIEEWTGCCYSSENIPEDWTTKWQNLGLHPNLHLPEENKYLASDFQLKHTQSDNQYPYKILENNQCRLWFKEDTKFKVPKASICFHFKCPSCVENVVTNTLLEVFVTILQQNLNEEAYPAAMANLNVSYEYTFEGFAFKIFGFNHKSSLLLETVLNCMQQLKVDENIFDNIKKHLTLCFNNQVLKPSKLGLVLELKLLYNNYWCPMDKLRALKDVTLEMLNDFVETHLSKSFIEGIIQGNVTQEEALIMNQMVLDKLKLQPPEYLVPLQCLKLPSEKSCCQSVSLCNENKNSSNCYIHQIGLTTIKNLCIVQLFEVIMYEPLFDSLRTNQQLGYDVYCTYRRWWNVIGLVISVTFQSAKFSSKYVEERVETFFNDFVKEMINISDEKFQTHLESFIESVKQDDLNIQEEADNNWYKLKKCNYDFNSKELMLEFLATFQKEDFVEWVNQHLGPEATQNILSIRVLGPKDENLNLGSIENKISNGGSDSKKNDHEIHLRFVTDAELNDAQVANCITNIEGFKSDLCYFPKPTGFISQN